MFFDRFKELLKGISKTPQQFSRQTHGLVSFFLLLFQLFILVSLDNSVWDQEVRIVACVLLSAVMNLISFAASLNKKKILFETFFFLSLVSFWIGTFNSALDKLSPLLSQKVALILETELYFLCAIVLMQAKTKVVIFVIGYLRMFIGLNYENIEEFTTEKIIGAMFYIMSFIITGLLSLAIVGNNAGNQFLQQKQHMRYKDLENILNNDIQQGILIVTPTQSTQSSQLSVRDLKVKYVNNCFLDQFKVSRLLALDVLPMIQARPPKHQPKIDQDISCNYTESTKNILERSVNGGEVPKQNAEQPKQRTSIFGLDYSKGNKPKMVSQEMSKTKNSGDDKDTIIADKQPIIKISGLKKETLILSSIQGSNNEQQTTKQQESFPEKALRLSIEKRERSQSKNNNNRRSSSNWRLKESLVGGGGTNVNSMSLLDGINLYHQHYQQNNQGQKPAQLQLLESQLIVWEYKSNLAARQSINSHPQANEQEKETNLENIMNQSNHQAPIINNKTNELPLPPFLLPTQLSGQQAPGINLKSKGSSPSQSHLMIKLFSDQGNSTLEMQPLQNQQTGGSSEVGLIKMQHDNKQQSLTIPNTDKDMKNSRGSGIRQKSYLSHNDKLVAQKLDDNTFEIVRKDKKNKTEIGKSPGDGYLQQDDQDLNEDDDEDGNEEGTDYLDIKLFECEMGQEESIMIVVNKVNERIKYEKLKEQQEKSEEMLANVTHDLKTPLNCMTLMAEGMKIGKEYDEVAISMILENANLLMCLIQDILDYSQIKKGKLRLLRTTFTPNEAISEVMNLFQMQADQKNIQLVASVEQNFPMNSDKNRIKQILINLVGNALKFTQEGSITITCQIQHLVSHHKIAVFQVKDTGVGMTNQIKSQLFKKFNTFNQKGLNKNGIGLGLTICKRLVMFLGPSDSIDVESEVAKGSVFSFKVFSDLTDIIDNTNKSISEESDDIEQQDSNNKYYEEQLEKHNQDKSKETNQSYDDQSRRMSASASIPFQGLNSKQNTSSAFPSGRSLIKDEDKIEDSMIAVNSFPETIIHAGPEFRNEFPLLEKKNNPSSISSITTPPNQLKTMLIVDDSPFNIAAYKLILKKYKPLSIIEAYNGKEAFEKYQKTSFACILMDYNMPIMNGDESTRLIRKFEKLNNLPACKIIIVSGFDNHRKEINKALQFGADDFLTKPVNFQLLFDKLNQLLGQ